MWLGGGVEMAEERGSMAPVHAYWIDRRMSTAVADLVFDQIRSDQPLRGCPEYCD